MEKVELIWEKVAIPDIIPPRYTEVTPEKIKQYAYAVDDWDHASIPVREESIGQAMLLANDCLVIYVNRYTGLSGLHTKCDIEVLNPPRPGKKVAITGRHVEKYEKRGHKYRVLESVATDEDGVVYLRTRNHETFAESITATKGSPGETPGGEVPSIVSEIQVPQMYKRIPTGAQIKPMKRTMSFEQIVAYTGSVVDLANEKSFHTDVDYAKSLGLSTVIAQGQMSACYISEMMTKAFGYGWRRGGKMYVKFINAVFAGDEIYVSGAVKDKVPEGDAIRVILDVWCENQSGKKVTVGEASGLVR